MQALGASPGLKFPHSAVSYLGERPLLRSFGGLVIHGTQDEAVPYEQSTYFQAYMKRLGVRCDLITVEDGLHGVIRWEKDARFQGYKSEMVDWLHANLGPGR